MKRSLLLSTARRRGVAFWLPAPRVMLLLGALGMLIGLFVDARVLPPGALAAICGSSDRALWPLMQQHWTLLPWTHVGMWAGGLAAIPALRAIRPGCRRRYCASLTQNVVCSGWMTVGMSAGVLVFDAIGAPSSPRLVVGMLVGMAAGMAASIVLYRAWFRARALRLPTPIDMPRVTRR